MVKNGKYFVPADKTDEDFKTLFRRLAHMGAGRPVDADGVATGPWTPDGLTKAISEIDDNEVGIDTRTVQLWFQDNGKGISSENVRWLARVFGCGDPEATSAWQAELAASQERLRNRRRRKDGPVGPSKGGEAVSSGRSSVGSPPRRSLALLSEATFGHGELLNLPILVFAGAACLNFAAYLIGIDSIAYVRDDGVTKQVGFQWAPNWTFLFLLFLPLFFAFAVDLLTFWKVDGRETVLSNTERVEVEESWTRKVERSSATYWATFVLCLPFAGVLQWIGVRLIPLMRGADSDDIDWGSIAIVRPDVISTTEAIAFTGFAYLYMAVCFYLMVVGLILLYTLAHDFWEMTRDMDRKGASGHDVEAIRARIMRGIFRCTVAGVLVAICMKTQSLFLPTRSETVWEWLFADAGMISTDASQLTDYAFAMHWTSILILLPTCFLFLYAIVRHGLFVGPSQRMLAAFTLVLSAYLLIGAFPGFSILLAFAVLVSIYGFFDPTFGAGRQRALEDSRSVP